MSLCDGFVNAPAFDIARSVWHMAQFFSVSPASISWIFAHLVTEQYGNHRPFEGSKQVVS